LKKSPKELKIKGKIGNFREDLVQQIWRTCLDDFARDLAPQTCPNFQPKIELENHKKMAPKMAKRINFST